MAFWNWAKNEGKISLSDIPSNLRDCKAGGKLWITWLDEELGPSSLKNCLSDHSSIYKKSYMNSKFMGFQFLMFAGSYIIRVAPQQVPPDCYSPLLLFILLLMIILIPSLNFWSWISACCFQFLRVSLIFSHCHQAWKPIMFLYHSLFFVSSPLAKPAASLLISVSKSVDSYLSTYFSVIHSIGAY